MKYQTFSRKQLETLSWWVSKNNLKNYSGIIVEGSIRSGKTITLSLSFILWAMSSKDREQFAICGKTIGSLRRNVINPLKQNLKSLKYKVIDRMSDNYLIVSKNGIVNTFYLFGGRDERSQDIVQGVTLSGVLFDEVALMPESFVNQAMARCSVEGSKFWFNCNPEGPLHWFKAEHIDKAIEKKYLILHTTLEDNPSLSAEIKNRYKSMFSGLFYKRYIEGLWVSGEGLIYDCFKEESNTYNKLPIAIEEDGIPYYAGDYGTSNPTVFLKAFIEFKDRLPYVYIDDEYYYDSKKEIKQKSDKEYVEDFNTFTENKNYRKIILDPAASSLIVALRQSGYIVTKADNEVLDGIKLVYTMLANGLLKINADKCPMLIKEIHSYSWDKKASKRGEDKPTKTSDHACDAMRYLVKTVIRSLNVYYGLNKNEKEGRS